MRIFTLMLKEKQQIKNNGKVPSCREPCHYYVFWSRRSDLNRRPAHYECAALPLSHVGILINAKIIILVSCLNVNYPY